MGPTRYKFYPKPEEKPYAPTEADIREEYARKLRKLGEHRLADKMAQMDLPLKKKKDDRQMGLFK